ncbi:hypothetical protein AAULR_08670 [Lacticaseibacillus rhamnosus MTCC 5462]|nr:hypothetical protein AAULR_08670 [Lacticaseibacillus rhamnosus MTCC 5462]
MVSSGVTDLALDRKEGQDGFSSSNDGVAKMGSGADCTGF